MQARVGALEIWAGVGRQLDSDQFELLLNACADQDASPSVRLLAADALARGSLSSQQLVALADALEACGPFELPRLLEAFHEKSGDELGQRLLAGLDTSPGFTSLRPDQVRTCLKAFSESIQQGSERLMARLNVDLSEQRAYLDQLQRDMPPGDIRRGQTVFNGTKAACSTCHEIGYLGGNVGPDLTTIGTVRSERDLLESLVYPSMSFVRSYEPTRVLTDDGRQFSGILREASDQLVVLIEGPDKEIRIDRSDVEEMLPGTVSVMPAGLDKQLSLQELSDLLAFLKATKWR
jgi:putative heme-binding domain-containing protein